VGDTNPEPIPDIADVQAVVEEHFPGLWPAVEAGLATAATLLLEANANPLALIYVGGPSSSKTTVADMFVAHSLCYRSDGFTPAAFVSQAANRTKKDLGQVDLLPRIKHKVLVTPELAPIFRGKEDDLARTFSIITRVLDGEGLVLDSGTHGRRGYQGDYLFAWLGCTTPFDAKVWRVMAQLGSRLFFYAMDDGDEISVDDLVQSDHDDSYRHRREQCRKAVHRFLTGLVESIGGVRSVSWQASADPEPVRRRIAELAQALATMRSEPTREGKEGETFTAAKRERPHRAYAILSNLARGHALIKGRRQLTEDDLPLIAHGTVSSMPPERGRVFTAVVLNGGEPLSISEVKAALRVRHSETARRVMEDLDRLGVMEVVKGSGSSPYQLRFRRGWEWCGSPEFASLLLATKNRGVCVTAPASAPNLAKHEKEEKEVEKGATETHTSQKTAANGAETDPYAMFNTPGQPVWDDRDAAH
jgi:hypothetical protein